jgi:hypothetical protein
VRFVSQIKKYIKKKYLSEFKLLNLSCLARICLTRKSILICILIYEYIFYKFMSQYDKTKNVLNLFIFFNFLLLKSIEKAN